MPKSKADLVTMLEDLAENSESAIARLGAIKQLLELKPEEEEATTDDDLYQDELAARRQTA